MAMAVVSTGKNSQTKLTKANNKMIKVKIMGEMVIGIKFNLFRTNYHIIRSP